VPVDNAASEQAVLHWLEQHQATVELTGYVSSNA